MDTTFSAIPLDTLSLDVAGELDAAWCNAGYPDTGLRIVGHRVSGNGMVTMLTVPGDNTAPCYTLSSGKYIHVTGPTLAEWQAEREYAEQRQEAADLREWAGGR